MANLVEAQDGAVLREGRAIEREIRLDLDDGAHTFLVLKFPIPDTADGASAIGAIATDITWRTRAEEALRQSDERFRAVVENSPNAIAMKDLDGRFQLVNGRFREWLGIGDIDLSDKTAYDVHEAEQADALTAQDRDVLARLAVVEREHSIRFADGKYHTIVTTKFPVLDDARQPIGVGSIGMDVTEQRAAEERLRQAMKMEAVGQLTGGVAHDFNNLLGTIMGNAELLEDRVGKADRQVHAILRAADLGAELTQRLLAFSRRQVLSPQPLALDKLVDDTCELLARTLGDNIEVGVRAQDGLWPAMVDPGQVENALLNLAINARDAMADGGRLSIDMDNRSIDDHDAAVMGLGPGDYVVLTVRDTGCGIAPSVLEQVFDPFFTTKDVGQGSGLGLSMVYGFAQQSGGHISIESEPGRGTTVRLLLPRATAVPASTEHADAADDADGRGETILILEDDRALRELAVAILRGLGYRVISAHNGEVARAILTQGGSVDLLLADVMLPGGLSGPALAEQAKILRPDIKILFMSGHAADALVKEGKLGNGVPIVQKPFRKAELARRVREALQEPAVDLQAVAAAR